MGAGRVSGGKVEIETLEGGLGGDIIQVRATYTLDPGMWAGMVAAYREMNLRNEIVIIEMLKEG